LKNKAVKRIINPPNIQQKIAIIKNVILLIVYYEAEETELLKIINFKASYFCCSENY